MDHFVDERDYKLLESDRYTFSVLRLIVGGACRLLLSDHRSAILCYSTPPYPVWLWTPDGAGEDEKEKAYALLLENGFLDGEHKLNVKYDLADYLIARAAKEGKTLRVYRNMFAYDCPAPVEPKEKADGTIRRCTEEDLEELVAFRLMFQSDTGVEHLDRDRARQSAEKAVRSGNIFFWTAASGENVSSCKYVPNGDLATVGFVFTRPGHRRKHYAENLVYQVTVTAKNAGFLPMLYTNADYAPSNACYEKIGYLLRGKLCTLR